jgi:DNA-binding CsgD family transcriptional regulator
MIKTWNLFKTDLSPKNIAESLNIDVTTVYKYLSRGYKLNIIQKRDYRKRGV